MQNFDKFFNGSRLSLVLEKAKTLSKAECQAIYLYFIRHSPRTILEFGTQYGCSTRVFLEISKWLEIPIQLHSWDVVDTIKENCVSKADFIFHKEDITGSEEEIIHEYKPDLVFLDAHPYALTKGLISSCLRNKVNFLCHDVSKKIYDRAKIRSNNFTNFAPSTMAEWELYLLCELINPILLNEDFFEDNEVKVTCFRERFGLAIVENKYA